MNHEYYMQRCLHLAIKGIGYVAPNPMVGSVVVHNGKIIGEGYHMQYGGPHAEVNAIRDVETQYLASLANGNVEPQDFVAPNTDSQNIETQSIASLLRESTIYVSLEPCSHFGKTPPCADLIISKQIPRVVIASYDPNPKVAGKGIQRLRDAGVEVITEILKQEADWINRRFFTFHIQHRPYIFLKWAQSKDGYIAPEGKQQTWLTTAASKQLVHKWRSEEQAVMVGKNTALIDNPQLTVREWQGKNPLRIVVDRNMEMPSSLHLFNDAAPTLVFNGLKDDKQGSIEWVKIDFGADAEEQMLKQLYKRNIQSLIIEGGAKLLQSFIQKGLWNEAQIFTSPTALGSGIKAPVVKGEILDNRQIDGDGLVIIKSV